jgi:hypothetical protein
LVGGRHGGAAPTIIMYWTSHRLNSHNPTVAGVGTDKGGRYYLEIYTQSLKCTKILILAACPKIGGHFIISPFLVYTKLGLITIEPRALRKHHSD